MSIKPINSSANRLVLTQGPACRPALPDGVTCTVGQYRDTLKSIFANAIVGLPNAAALQASWDASVDRGGMPEASMEGTADELAFVAQHVTHVSSHGERILRAMTFQSSESGFAECGTVEQH